ncbi:hypothetical protein GGR38_001264 [Novosphingobium sediminicola]|uniref:Uncharacterized protein n=1 Tax=Novosphingobium sediminicola TaxID=563162 RepID=A0A7W6CMR3_9SPHN|nr:hypothetical protein [Novosphingobium sediminicola]
MTLPLSLVAQRIFFAEKRAVKPENNAMRGVNGGTDKRTKGRWRITPAQG